MEFNKLEEMFLAQKFGSIIQAFRDHILEFTLSLIADRPTTLCVCVHNSEEPKKYTVLAMAYSDDEELMDSLVLEIDNIMSKKFKDRYPDLLEHIAENHRGEDDKEG